MGRTGLFFFKFFMFLVLSLAVNNHKFLSQNNEISSNGLKLPSPTSLGGGSPFLIMLCVTLLRQHRDRIMSARMDYNELAMHLDRMVRKHNVRSVLREARALYRDYQAQYG